MGLPIGLNMIGLLQPLVDGAKLLLQYAAKRLCTALSPHTLTPQTTNAPTGRLILVPVPGCTSKSELNTCIYKLVW